ncbi:uncharacterized protein [Typha angustifolia]|uniref:uncharacterized protein isoform X1 n=1 Tax=Typha angustifolia TaxID=59011 RepID=UPI003C303C61
MERLSLIDVSSEDDFLVSSSCEGLFDPSSSGPQESNFEMNYFELETAISPGGNLGNIYKQIIQVPELSESPERKRNNSSKYNLRKSLAWDSAFFTSEGVLNPEELATVTSTLKKAETSALPGIPEETRRSGESISTLDSDGLENLEIELFDNVRASIQKSLGTSDKALNKKNCGLIKDHKGLNASRIGLKEKVARSSQNKMKFPVEVKRHGLSKQRSDSITKEVPINMKVVGAGTADAKASLKPPRILPKATLQKVPSKAALASGNTHKSSTSGGVINQQPSYKTTEVASSVTSRSIGPPRRMPSLPSSSMAISTSSSSSHGTLVRSSTDSTKSPLGITKKTRNTNHSSSGSATNKIPLKARKSRTMSRSPADLQTCLNPTMKFSNISPSSSIDSVASEASSSASTAMKSTHTMDGLDAGSSSPSLSLIKGNCLYSSSSQKLHQPIAESKSPSTLIDCEHSLKDPTAVPGTSEPASGDLSNSSSKGRYFKPSGLRMPTPKIGYFDAEKNLVRNIDTSSQTGQQSSLVKSTSGVNKLVVSDTVKPTNLRYAGPPTKKFAVTADSPHSQVDNRSSAQRTKPASPTFVQQESKLPPLDFSKEAHNESCIKVVTDDIAECGQLNMESPSSKLQPYSMTTVPLGREAAVSCEGYSDLACRSTRSPDQEVADSFPKRKESCPKEHLITLSSEKENIPANSTDGSDRNIQSKDLTMAVVELMREKLSSLTI